MIYIANESDKNSLNERIDTTESKQSLWFNFAISALKLANSLFVNGEVVLPTVTEGLSPAVENKHIILRGKMQK